MRDRDGSVVALSRHLDILWGSRVIDPWVYVGGGGPETYVVSFLQILKSVTCPVGV